MGTEMVSQLITQIMEMRLIKFLLKLMKISKECMKDHMMEIIKEIFEICSY